MTTLGKAFCPHAVAYDCPSCLAAGVTLDPRPAEDRVQAMADALHEDCRLEWQAIAAVDPQRQVTQHMADAHYGQAHDLVRRLAR